MKQKSITILVGSVLLIIIAGLYTLLFLHKDSHIKVGIIHSKTGTMALNEEPIIQATLLAINEVNNQGGVLGKQILPIIMDGKSDPEVFTQQAEKLISDHNTEVIFGCWTSSSRKAVKSIVEKYNHLLFYPVQYEGYESSNNIIYTGAAPNQQLIPALLWGMNNLGKKIFLIGSDYIFPQTAHAIIKKMIPNNIVGETLIPFGAENCDDAIKQIKKCKPDMIFNTINGSSNIIFFQNMKSKFTDQNRPHIMSLSISETDFDSINIENLAGTYACWNYFQSIDSIKNDNFTKNFSIEYGINQLINDPMEAAYFSVHLWAQAVNKSKSLNKDKIKQALYTFTLQAPEGAVQIDPENNHTWKTVRIGKINTNKEFDIVWSSKIPIKPNTHPQTTHIN